LNFESAKEINPSIKVLLSSAQETGNLEFRKQAAAANVDGLLQKPFSLFSLIDIIEGKEPNLARDSFRHSRRQIIDFF
jgi:hypothetical protein